MKYVKLSHNKILTMSDGQKYRADQLRFVPQPDDNRRKIGNVAGISCIVIASLMVPLSGLALFGTMFCNDAGSRGNVCRAEWIVAMLIAIINVALFVIGVLLRVKFRRRVFEVIPGEKPYNPNTADD